MDQAQVPGTDVLLLHAMMLMVVADGHLDPQEQALLEACYAALPEFRERPFRVVLDGALVLMRRYPSVAASVESLGALETPALKKRAWLLAADIARASGSVDEREQRLLDAMQRVLEVDDEAARQIGAVLDIKYGWGD